MRADRSRSDPDARAWRRRHIVLAICSASLFMNYVDSTILNVALPTLGRDLHAGVSSLQWVVDAYMLVLASLLLLSGSTADRIGRRRVFSVGLVTFSAGSLLCSLAPSVGALIAFRAIQALGGCMLTPVSLSIVRNVFTDPAERARAMGIWSAVFGLATACGPIIGGILVNLVGWRSVFWVNVPVGIVAVVATQLLVPESRAPRPRRVDVPGQVLVIVALASLTGAIIEGPTLSWGAPLILGLFALGGAALVALVAVELRRAEPLLEVRFFRSRPFSAATAIGMLSFTVLSGFLFVNTLDLQLARGDSALGAGLAILPATAAIPIAAIVSGRVLARRGPRLVMAGAGVALAGGMALLATASFATAAPVLALAYLLVGLGMGFISPPTTHTGVNAMPPDQAGVASAVTSTSRQLGNMLGVAVMGALFTSSLHGELGTRLGALGIGASRRAAITADVVSGSARDRGEGHAVQAVLHEAIVAATHLPSELGIACGLACTLLALGFTGRRAHAAAARIHADEPLAPLS